MEDFLSYLVKNLVENKEAVRIEKSIDTGVKILHLSVSPDEMGKVIGKEGKVIRALRAALKVRAFTKNEKFYLVLEEETHGQSKN